MTSPAAERTITVSPPINLRLTLGPLRRGRGDPTMWMGPSGVWRATRTPCGAVTTHVTVDGTAVRMRAWGPGADWALHHLPDLVGAHDDASALVAKDPIVAGFQRRVRGLRLSRSLAVAEALVPTVIEQKVVGLEAKRSYARLVRSLGEPAPTPGGEAAPTPGSGPPQRPLMLPPSPATLAGTPSYVFHRFGIERKRADTIRRACSYAARLEQTVDMAPADAQARMQLLPGIGAWTAAEVALVALGDPDAVSVGDYHLPHQVAWALAGEARADDARMLELLEPYRGQRGRVIRLILAGMTSAPPRYGPRRALRCIASI